MLPVPRVLHPPAGSFFLFGPRGTGKSTWTRARFPDALFIDLLDEVTLHTLSAVPGRFEALVRAHPDRVVVVDEIQRLPELLAVVHRLIEAPGRDWRFVLTGSSARKLRRGGVDLLAGRAVTCAMFPFLACELGARFDLAQVLELGLLPVVLDAPDPAATLRAYVGTYLKEEVQQEGIVRSVGSFSRFLTAISFSHGAPLSPSHLARECAVPRTTVIGYLDVLDDLLLSFRVPIFRKRAARAMITKEKLFLFDPGVYRSLRPMGPLDRPEAHGAALEGLVAQHLRTWMEGSDLTLYWWRTRGGSEVDLVVYGADGFWAIEVKNSATVRPADLRGLRTFATDYPECTPILLYRGERLRIGDIRCEPVDGFLRQLTPGRAFPAPERSPRAAAAPESQSP